MDVGVVDVDVDVEEVFHLVLVLLWFIGQVGVGWWVVCGPHTVVLIDTGSGEFGGG